MSEKDTLTLYMQNIGRYPLLSPEEESQLSDRIAAGDTKALQRLVCCNLRLVVKIAYDFKSSRLPLMDLITEGTVGLMRAAQKFRPNKGAKMSTYAAWWIKQAMHRALNNQTSIIRVPVQSAAKIGKIRSARTRLTTRLGRRPTIREIAEAVNLTERTVNGLRHGRPYTVSMQAPIRPGEDEGEIKDLLPDNKTEAPDRILQNSETLDVMMRLASRLDRREKVVLDLRFGLSNGVPSTLDQVSAQVGRTRERVRQIQNQALAKLRAMLNENGQYDVGKILRGDRIPPDDDLNLGNAI